MLFNSIHFVLFFVVVTLLYFILPHKYRWFMLLISSCYFYMSFIPVYILILGFTIVIDYFAGIMIEQASGKRKKIFLTVSLVANIGVLACFKYFNFLNENFSQLLSHLGYVNPVPFLAILLPIGLSFHTFQAMSYTIEVYRGHQQAERNFGVYSLYVMFYPQLVAGPIERPQNLLHQFYEKHYFDYARVVDGLTLMLQGFFKKLVIADRLSLYVNAVYNNPQHHNGPTLLVATVFFAFQIYCDFSGYSDIAIGAAKVMGFHLMTNFNRPYFSRSIAEFWKRWHISLSTWFKDYLYISMGGNKVGRLRWYFNLFIVFLVSGLWHGASWTFVIWGALNGIYLVAGIITGPYTDRLMMTVGFSRFSKGRHVLEVLTTFALCCFSWIFFRANSLADAWFITGKIFTMNGPVYYENPSTIILCVLAVVLLLGYELVAEFNIQALRFGKSSNPVVRNLSYAVMIILILLVGAFDGGQFIYFQF